MFLLPGAERIKKGPGPGGKQYKDMFRVLYRERRKSERKTTVF